jgi:hypothetical protein
LLDGETARYAAKGNVLDVHPFIDLEIVNPWQ